MIELRNAENQVKILNLILSEEDLPPRLCCG